MVPTGDVTKLPKWAQTHIANLERELRTAKELNEALSTPAEGSQAVVVDYINGDRGVQLGEWGRSIRIHLTKTPKGPFDQSVDVSFDQEGELQVRSQEGPLIIQPQSSNAIRLTLDRR